MDKEMKAHVRFYYEPGQCGRDWDAIFLGNFSGPVEDVLHSGPSKEWKSIIQGLLPGVLVPHTRLYMC